MPREAKAPVRKQQWLPCSFCDRYFMGFPEWKACGRLICQAKAYWSPPQWANAAEMAEIRQLCGLPLNDLDQLALRKAKR